MQPVAERGGSDQALLRLVRSLPPDEFDFHIALPGPTPLADDFAAAGATLHQIPMRRLSTSHGAAEWAAYAAGWPVAVAHLARLARKLGVDVVHSNSLHTWYGWAAARLVRRPHVVHAREIVVQSGAALRVERTLCRYFASRVIAVSYAVAAQLDPANVVVLDEALDPAEFSPTRAGAFRRKVDLGEETLVVGAVARLDPLKGLDVLLDAYGEVRAARPGTELVIVGNPVLDQDRYAAELRVRVAETPGAMLLESRDDIPEVMADLDVLALAVDRARVVRPRARRGARQRNARGHVRSRRAAGDRGPGDSGGRTGRHPRRRRRARRRVGGPPPRTHLAGTPPGAGAGVRTVVTALRRDLP